MLEPIDTTQLTSANVDALTIETRQKMLDALVDISDKQPMDSEAVRESKAIKQFSPPDSSDPI